MVEIRLTYEGDLHCSVVHQPSGSVIATDAPLDNNGRGEAFSPTDLVAAALASCMATVIGTPPNAIAAALLEASEPVDFLRWTLLAAPPAV